MFDTLRKFRDKLGTAVPVIGTAVTFNDLLVSEATVDSVDFLSYDMEHVQHDPAARNAHRMAARGGGCPPTRLATVTETTTRLPTRTSSPPS